MNDARIRNVSKKYALAAPGANTNMLSSNLVPGTNSAAYRVTVSLATGSVFDVRVTDGTTAYTIHLNAGTALTASCLYTFTFGVNKALQYNFRVATDGIIQYLQVDECNSAVV